MKSLTVQRVEPQDIVEFLQQNQDQWFVYKLGGALRRDSDTCCPLEAYFDLLPGSLQDCNALTLSAEDPTRLMLEQDVELVMDASDNRPNRLAGARRRLSAAMRKAALKKPAEPKKPKITIIFKKKKPAR